MPSDIPAPPSLMPPTRRMAAPRPAHPMTGGPMAHFFGYYHATPWSADGRRLLALAATDAARMPAPGERATIGLIDAVTGDWRPVAETAAWNWQAGCMLQWLPPGDRHLIYNDRRDGALCSVILDVEDGTARTIPRPVADVSHDGRLATSLDFARLARARPVVGYAVEDSAAAIDPAPDDDGVWLLDVATGDARLLLSVAEAVAVAEGPDFATAALGARYAGQPGYEQPGAGGHRIDGAAFSPQGTRLLIGHRWPRQRPLQLPHFQRHFWDRLLVLDLAGGPPRLLGEDGFHSHAAWVDDRWILSWSRHAGVDGLWLFDAVGEVDPQPFAHGGITADPHASFSPDGRFLLGDGYPDEGGCRPLWICDLRAGVRYDLGAFHSPPPYDRGPIRCDLHPRWSRDGRQVCIDSAHEGSRQVYVLDVADITGDVLRTTGDDRATH